MKYLYYPGCSLKSTGRGYEESLLAVLKALGVPFEELDDWNCCGATSYMGIDENKAFALAARNLAIAEGQTTESPAQVLAPCAACYMVLSKAKHYIADSPALKSEIIRALGAAQMSYAGTAQVRHPLDVLANELGTQAIADKVKKPLKGMKIACYYGCQIVRPYAEFDSQHNPTTMDRLMEALGAEVIDWPLKTRCCGGTLTGTVEEVGLRLNYILLREAKRRGADVMVTACPLCQFNLECYQPKISQQNDEDISLPVVYFTQLMGVALGLSESELGLNRLFVPLKTRVAV